MQSKAIEKPNGRIAERDGAPAELLQIGIVGLTLWSVLKAVRVLLYLFELLQVLARLWRAFGRIKTLKARRCIRTAHWRARRLDRKN